AFFMSASAYTAFEGAPTRCTPRARPGVARLGKRSVRTHNARSRPAARRWGAGRWGGRRLDTVGNLLHRSQAIGKSLERKRAAVANVATITGFVSVQPGRRAGAGQVQSVR